MIDCCDPDCDCALIGRDPGVIRFGRPFEGHDLFAVHGSFIPTTPIDPHGEKVSFQLTNANGVFYQIEVPIGGIQQRSRHLFRFRDREAQKKRSGLFRLDIRFFPRDQRFTFLVKSYGDLSGATRANIALQFAIGDDAFNNVSIWSARPFGWLLQLPGGQLPQCPALLD